MAQALADVTGVETIKTLVACLGVPDFTVDELALQAGVSRRTVDTVVRRYQHAFDRLPSDKPGGRGRPPVRWQLRTDHLDEVVAAVDSNQSALSAGQLSELASAPEPAAAEASLIMAATALARGSDDAEQTRQLVATARNSLASAGFDPDGLPRAGQQPGQELAGRARFIAAVADVADACLSEDQKRIDEAQAQAMPHVVQAARYMSAAEWMPLAQKVVLAPGTVLTAPVLVAEESVKYFNKLFPTLRRLFRKKDVPAGFVCMADTRAKQSAVPTAVTSLLNFRNPAETRRKRLDGGNLADCVVVSSKSEVLKPAAERGAHFILDREIEATKTQIANAVNSRVAWGVGLPGAARPAVPHLPGAVTPGAAWQPVPHLPGAVTPGAAWQPVPHLPGAVTPGAAWQPVPHLPGAVTPGAAWQPVPHLPDTVIPGLLKYGPGVQKYGTPSPPLPGLHNALGDIPSTAQSPDAKH